MLARLGYGISGHFAPGGDIETPPPPLSFLWLADGASFLLLSDSSSKLRRP